VLPCGDAALLVEAGDAALGVYAALLDRPPDGVTDLVPAARTVLVRFDPALATAPDLARQLAAVRPVATMPGPGELVTVPVHYDGADLAEVGRLTGLGADGVVEAHTAARYVVAFSGFAPGFGYLTGLDPRLRLPRRGTPRVRVPAGAVGVAGEFTGVYPRSSPGGWHLLGRTSVPLWDPGRTPPALLRPGTRVRFDPVPALRCDPPPQALAAPGPPGLEVVHCGPMATVQDGGRPGYTALGVGRSGAADAPAAALANRLVGNAEGAACLELTFGSATLLFHRATRVAVTGAPCRLDRAAAMNAPLTVPAGATLTIGVPGSGVRTYVAVRGGVAVPPVLGSRSTDVLSGLGPPALSPGDLLPIGTDHSGPPPGVDVAPVNPPAAGELTVRVLPGPRADWCTADALATLLAEPFTVSADSNRVGVRLSGPALARARHEELPSEGMVPGAIQVPPAGQPVVFLADHPVTGGYPVLAVVVSADLPVLAQARPGQQVRFQLATQSAAAR
jgi:KipI family sensor histidine kinase inhibitor